MEVLITSRMQFMAMGVLWPVVVGNSCLGGLRGAVIQRPCSTRLGMRLHEGKVAWISTVFLGSLGS